MMARTAQSRNNVPDRVLLYQIQERVTEISDRVEQSFNGKHLSKLTDDLAALSAQNVRRHDWSVEAVRSSAEQLSRIERSNAEQLERIEAMTGSVASSVSSLVSNVALARRDLVTEVAGLRSEIATSDKRAVDLHGAADSLRADMDEHIQHLSSQMIKWFAGIICLIIVCTVILFVHHLG